MTACNTTVKFPKITLFSAAIEEILDVSLIDVYTEAQLKMPHTLELLEVLTTYKSVIILC